MGRLVAASCGLAGAEGGTGDTKMKNRRPGQDRGALPLIGCSAALVLGLLFGVQSAVADAAASGAAGDPAVGAHAGAAPAGSPRGATAAAERALTASLPTAEARTLYTLGQLISRTLEGFDLSEQELGWVQSGLVDGVTRAAPRVDLEAEAAGLHALQAERRNATLLRERSAGARFVASVAQSAAAERHPSGVVIERVQPGEGAQPTATDHVEVHYEGRLIDGTLFDSSRQRGKPAKFPVRGVIACWTEALQVMRVGGRSRVVCPAELAYGDRGSPPVIKPGATLVFDIELLAIVR